jgi:tRNA A37 methylthiotransferase MiaB
MATIGVISLGCAKNQVDTERMLGILAGAGHAITNDPAKAEILIVNTCGFIESAKQESIDAILEMAQYKSGGRCKKLVATGCLSERYRDELREAMPEIDILLGVREYEPCQSCSAQRITRRIAGQSPRGSSRRRPTARIFALRTVATTAAPTARFRSSVEISSANRWKTSKTKRGGSPKAA